MLTCTFCDRSLTTCASCKGSCHEPMCHECAASGVAPSHGGTITLPQLGSSGARL